MNTIEFGVYKGESIESVIRKDPHYIEWAMKNVKKFKLTKEEKKLLSENLSKNE